MISLIFSTIQTACNLGNINANNWIWINAMVILAMFSIGALVYSLSTLLPSQSSKKIKSTIIYELSEGIISLLIFISLISLVYASCSVGAGLSGQSNYQNLFQADEYYVGTLLFVKGTSLVTDLTFQGITLSIDGNIVSILLDQVTSSLNSALGGINGISIGSGTSAATGTGGSSGAATIGGSQPSSSVTAGFGITLANSGDVESLFDSYAGVYVSYGMIIVITFGLLFVLYFLFPIISAIAFALIVPVSLIMRSFSFLGPKIREISNTLLALAIAFYIVFPLTISMNSYVISWLFCTNTGQVCNPYLQYTGNYKIAQIPLGDLFKQNTVSFLNYGGISFNLPVNFYSSLAGNAGGVGAAVANLFEGVVATPLQIDSFSTKIAEYFFEGVLLVAIDFMITLAFAQGLNKALNTIPGLLQSG